MATTTQNLGLIEPAGTDHALVANINTNSEKIDAEAGKARANFALVQNGDTATQAISQGQLVVWKGALKKATANIASGATLSNSNLTDDSIAAELASLNSNFTMQQVTPTNVRSSLNIDSNNSYSLGNLVVINIRCTATANISAGNTIFDIPTPTHNGINGDSVCARFPIILDSGTGSQYGYYNGNGHVYTTSQLNQGEYYYINFVYRKS